MLLMVEYDGTQASLDLVEVGVLCRVGVNKLIEFPFH